MKTKAPGKGLLKVVGIIYIVMGVLALLGSISNIITLKAWAEGSLDAMVLSIFEQNGLTYEIFRTSVVLSILSTLLSLTAGIVGVVNCNKIERAKVCFVFGILLIVFELAEQAYSAFSMTFGITNVVGLVLGLILPLLYFWGALKNRQATVEEDEEVIS